VDTAKREYALLDRQTAHGPQLVQATQALDNVALRKMQS